MWVLDYFAKKRAKKAFRVIQMSYRMKRMEPFTLIVTRASSHMVQTTIKKQVIEHHHCLMQRIQPMKIQVVQWHLHQNIITQRIDPRSSNPFKSSFPRTLKHLVQQLLRQSFLDEQAYFRTRPTLAKTMFHRILLQQPTNAPLALKHVPAFHLEILKQTLQKQSVPLPSFNKEESTPSDVFFKDADRQSIIQEIMRQMRREAWRKGRK